MGYGAEGRSVGLAISRGIRWIELQGQSQQGVIADLVGQHGTATSLLLSTKVRQSSSFSMVWYRTYCLPWALRRPVTLWGCLVCGSMSFIVSRMI